MDEVRKVQILLTGRGNATRIDGLFGADTERKVREAQFAIGIPVDGKVGGDTWHRLVEEGINSDRSEQLLELYQRNQSHAQQPIPPTPPV